MKVTAQLKCTVRILLQQNNKVLSFDSFYHLMYRSKRTRNITLVCSNFLLERYRGPKKNMYMYLSQCNSQ